MSSSPRHVLLAVGAGLAMADAAVVVLALPPILSELETSVRGVAAVIGVYTLVVAAAVLVADALARRHGAPAVGMAGFGLFAVGCLGCGLAGSLELLLAMRAVQAVGAAGGLVAAFALLDGGAAGRRLWVPAAVFGAAVGPALGGALTELLDWRAIFLAQVPFAGLAAVACVGPRAGSVVPVSGRGAFPALPAIALGLVSAALTGVLFLLVLLVVAGWSLSPLAGAAVVSVLPLAAFAGARLGGAVAATDAFGGPEPPKSFSRRSIAAIGCALVGAGVLALAFLPGDSVGWTIAPQLLAGAGMGLALPALAGGLLPERATGDAARLLAARHAGITLALAVLAPVTAVQLDAAVESFRERAVAVTLDARLPPLDKIRFAATVVDPSVDEADPRGELERTFREHAGRFDEPDEREAYVALEQRADDTLVRAVDEAFAPAFLICGALALLAAVVLAPRTGGRARRIAVGVGAAALVLPVLHAAVTPGLRPAPVTIGNPCERRDRPDTGGIDGFLQDVALAALDRAACRFGSSREELVLGIVDRDEAREFERRHGVDPRSAGDLVRGVVGF